MSEGAIVQVPVDELTVHRDQMQSLYREANLQVMPRYIDKLMSPNAKVDDLRKAAEFLAKVTDAAIQREVDANSNLPIFQIVFNRPGSGSPGMQVIDVSPPEQLQMIEEIPGDLLGSLNISPAKPTAPPRLASDYLDDLDDMLGIQDDA